MCAGLYLYNPKQQEVVVDYFRNLRRLALFRDRSKQPGESDRADHAEQHRVGLSLRAALESEEADEIAMSWFRQNRFLGTFLIGLRGRDDRGC